MSVPGSVVGAVKTLLSTDFVGSTELLAAVGDRRGSELFARTDRLARDLMVRFNGREIDRTDGFLLQFDRPIDATRFAFAYHAALAAVSREFGAELACRAGIHVGELYLRENSEADVARGAKPVEVEGLAKSTAARLATLAGPKQTLMTETAFDAVREAAAKEELADAPLEWLAHGSYSFKGVDQPLDVYEVGIVGAAPLAVPADTVKAKRAVNTADEITLGWRPAPGQEIPRRPGWVIDAKLGEGGFGEAWLATHRDTGERHVFKFCFAANRLRSLRREVTLFRLIKNALGSRDDIARILDWQFDEPPFFLEAEYTPGGNFEEWAAAQGGLAHIPLPVRLELIAQTAVAVAAAHSVGVLHKDIKPANVLIATAAGGSPQARLTDFGIGGVEDARDLLGRGITAQGFTHSLSAADTAGTGTFMYMAPEIIEGRPATIQADLYSLGVMLYQVVAGDFGRAVATSWPRDVEDELLREEIAALLDGDPARRPASALIVAEHLRQLEERRTGRELERRRQEEAAALQRALQRSQKRRRQLSIAAAVASIVLVVVSLLAVQTARARREADLRRGQAEDLFGFMLGDLRGRLKPVGRLDVLDEVAAKAIRHFDSIPASMRTDADLVRHAKTLAQLGQVRVDQGRLPDAQKAFEQSLSIAESAVSRNPRNGEWLFELGQSQYWMGAVLRRQGNAAAALPYWQAYLDTAKRLTSLDPSRAEWQLEVGYAHGNLGLLQEGRGDFEAAVQSYRGSMAIKEALARAKPGDAKLQADVAVSHNKIATVLEKMGNLSGAVAEYQAERRIREEVAARDPKNADWKWRLAVSCDNTGRLYLALGRTDDARAEFERYLALVTDLTTLDPANQPWRRGRAIAHLDLGLVARERPDFAEAERQYRLALGIMDDATLANAANVDWKIDAAFLRRLLAEARLAQQDNAGALREVRTALAILDEKPARAGDRKAARERAFAHILLGRLLAASGRAAEADEAWLRASEVSAVARDSHDWELLEAWAASLIHRGRLDEAAPVVERLTGLGFRRAGFVRLCREHHLNVPAQP